MAKIKIKGRVWKGIYRVEKTVGIARQSLKVAIIRYYSIECFHTIYPTVLGLHSYTRAISSGQPNVNICSS